MYVYNIWRKLLALRRDPRSPCTFSIRHTWLCNLDCECVSRLRPRVNSHGHKRLAEITITNTLRMAIDGYMATK